MFAMGPAFFRPSGYSTLALTGTFAGASVGVPYTSSVAISGGAAPYSLTGGTGVASGTLPAGLSLSISGSALVLSGTPTTAATNIFTVSVGSADAQTATSAQSVVVSAAVVYTQWDPAMSVSGASITGSGLILGPGIVWSPSRAASRTVAAISGKRYFSLGTTRVAYDTVTFSVGIGDATLDTTSGNPGPGETATSFGYWGPDATQAGGGLWWNNTRIFSGLTAASSVEFAVDTPTRNVWVRTPGSAWYGDGDPAAGTSPTATIAGTGAIYVVSTVRGGSPEEVTLQSDPANITGAAPSGFTVGLPA